MMMVHKHLRELLSEDQEPFLLKNYIDERLCQLKRPVPKTQLQVQKRKPISENSSFPVSFSKNACFFSFHGSPDVRKSPLFDFSSPAIKSPCRNSNTLFVPIPARTATILLEAALRIQKQSSSPKQRNTKSLGFGFLGSIFKKITSRKQNRKRGIKGDEAKVSVKDILRWDSSDCCRRTREHKLETPERTVDLEKIRDSEIGCCCSCNSRLSSVWSESNEEKSLDLETSSSRSEEMEFVVGERKNRDYSQCEKGFCSSPFRFSLQKCPSPGCRTPEFKSPATSPSCYKKEVEENEEENSKEYEEEVKEQSSPVSVLDTLFEDGEVHEDEDEVEEKGEEDDGLELERSFAIVQKSKQQLLNKLRRFERLAELDPFELEKAVMEEEEEEEKDEEFDDDDLEISDSEKSVDGFVREVLRSSNFYHLHRIPVDLKRLILDLIEEEDSEEPDSDDKEVIKKRVCMKLESWNEVESNTIDMMVDLDYRREGGEWNRNHEQVRDTAVEIEIAIFGFLVEELSEELSHSSGL
ncbi:hypothetical protein HHK36_018068 [Tetracentron sinense]|uniref:DUF4378 domain-containing protein n=1 Tax=Tetracentron sinense TaxID=13715 RepID=A0A834YVB0_TETSI|nr:hypothetical protein HHK36_018068 [Tetracentron sinense]